MTQPLTASPLPAVPPDDPTRQLVIARPDCDEHLPPLGIAGDTYTLGTPVGTRTEAAPPLDDATQASFLAAARVLAPEYHTELLRR